MLGGCHYIYDEVTYLMWKGMIRALVFVLMSYLVLSVFYRFLSETFYIFFNI